jgi:hypothetical protein
MEVELLYCGAGVGLLFSFYNSMLLIPVYTPGHAKIHSTDGFLIQNQLWLCTNIQAHFLSAEMFLHQRSADPGYFGQPSIAASLLVYLFREKTLLY